MPIVFLRILLFCLVFTIPFMAQATALRCSQTFSQTSRLKVVQSEYLNKSTPESFRVEDAKNYEIEFEAFLNPSGQLSFSASLSFHDLGYRSSFSGKELYKEKIDHFGLDNIESIKGIWVHGTNYDQFIDAIFANKNHFVAAQETWSGKMAANYGFTEVHSVDLRRDPILGIPTVNVVFVRP